MSDNADSIESDVRVVHGAHAMTALMRVRDAIDEAVRACGTSIVEARTGGLRETVRELEKLVGALREINEEQGAQSPSYTLVKIAQTAEREAEFPIATGAIDTSTIRTENK